MDNTLTKAESSLGIRFSCSAITESPLHIGSGDVLSPLADYDISGRKILYVDPQRFALLLEERNKTSEYIKQVRNATDKNKSGFLNTFFRIHLKEDLNKYIIPEKTCQAHVSRNPVELSEFITTNGRPFVPGSSIKGAFRSALLFNWLKTKEGEEALNFWWGQFEELYQRRSSNQIQQLLVDLVESRYFGKMTDKGRIPMSSLKVFDSPPLSRELLSVWEVTRSHFKAPKNQKGITVLKECLDPFKEFRFDVSFDFTEIRNNKKVYSRVFDDALTPEALCKILNDFSITVLDYEAEAITEDIAEQSAFKLYTPNVDQMFDNISHADPVIAYVRLGFGKMQFFQTIALILFNKFGRNKNDKRWKKYLNYCNNLKDRNAEDPDPPFPYPITRAYTTEGQQQLGWLSIEIKNK